MSLTAVTPLRLGFLGTGWIGRARMASLLEDRLAQASVIVEPGPSARADARALAPAAVVRDSFEELLAQADELDGLVIATPSALHAEQSLAGLAEGLAIFVQKPLARNREEASRVLAAAARVDRPFGVDLSYRHTSAFTGLRERLAAGAIGEPVALELVFENAYGPDRPWFLDRRQAGGGCLIDLGSHLLDLALELTGAPGFDVVDVELRHRGRPLAGLDDKAAVEDFAWASLRTTTGVPVRLACSWFGPAGRACRIGCTLIGSEGALCLENVDGSFYDLSLELRRGTSAERLVAPPDEWGGRAIAAWARALGTGERFDDDAATRWMAVAATLDALYAEAGRCVS